MYKVYQTRKEGKNLQPPELVDSYTTYDAAVGFIDEIMNDPDLSGPGDRFIVTKDQ
jgi:hypothetical protein